MTVARDDQEGVDAAMTAGTGIELDRIVDRITRLRNQVRTVYLGPARGLDLAIGCLLAGGHLLLDDVPGVGKTTLARALARSLNLEFNRVQFTSDLLPGDITGSHVYDPNRADFSFRKGPVFTNLLLADEINRASPRTQSSLLECMEERSVTIDGTQFTLPHPFWVVATQNPVETQGTFLLPRSQLDRFLVRTSLGYPDPDAELEIIENARAGKSPQDLKPILEAGDIEAMQTAVDRVHASDSLKTYVIQIMRATRTHPSLILGAGPRASIALLRLGCAWALLQGRDFATPDDIKGLIHPVLAHRLVEREGEISPARPETLQRIVETVPSPL